MQVKVDPTVFSMLSFANKFAENLGMPHYFGLEKPVALAREPNEVFFTLDLSLYPETNVKKNVTASHLKGEVNFNTNDSEED